MENPPKYPDELPPWSLRCFATMCLIGCGFFVVITLFGVFSSATLKTITTSAGMAGMCLLGAFLFRMHASQIEQRDNSLKQSLSDQRTPH